MTSPEKTAVISLAGIFSLRMFGLFMLLPVLAIHTSGLSGATPFLTGLALGVYGLTQAILQIPFGMLSDRIDRKKVIAAGLMIFALGSAIAAMSDSIVWLIVGRAVQGAGAVSAAILALTADLTQSKNRTVAMAAIGMTIGATFILSLVIAPVLQNTIGIHGMFWTTCALSLFAIAVLFRVVPDADSVSRGEYATLIGEFGQVFRITGMVQLFFGIFISHMVLTALFLVLPATFESVSGLALGDHWRIYVPVLLASVLGMVPFVIAASKRKWITWSYRIAILFMVMGMFNLIPGDRLSLTWLLAWVTLFFVAFNALESMLPSLVSQIAPRDMRGTAIGIYNTCLFGGVFVGGSLGGVILGRYGLSGVILFLTAMVCLWLLVALMSPGFRLSSTRVVHIGAVSDSRKQELIARIGGLNGIEEVKIYGDGTEAFLEIDESTFDGDALDNIIQKMGDH